MRRALLPLFIALLTGCTNPAVVAIPGPIPPPPPGMAQIILYRQIGYYEPSDVLRVALNQYPTGILPRGTVLYRNLAPGSYTISFSPTRPDPDQFKTVALGAGQVVYVKLAALPVRPCTGRSIAGCDMNGYTTMLMTPAAAQQELQGLTLISG
jgi:hypothetical protein